MDSAHPLLVLIGALLCLLTCLGHMCLQEHFAMGWRQLHDGIVIGDRLLLVIRLNSPCAAMAVRTETARSLDSATASAAVCDVETSGDAMTWCSGSGALCNTAVCAPSCNLTNAGMLATWRVLLRNGLAGCSVPGGCDCFEGFVWLCAAAVVSCRADGPETRAARLLQHRMMSLCDGVAGCVLGWVYEWHLR